MDSWAMEATIPNPAEIKNLAAMIAPGAEICLSTLFHVSLDQQIDTVDADLETYAGGAGVSMH